jgi:hypothetical protein
MLLIGRRLSADELTAVRADPTTVESLIYADHDDAEPGPALDLDKAWHGIHFLLTGSAWEIGEGAGGAVLGGEPIGGDTGYGPIRLLPPEAVRTVAAGLATLEIDELRARFDPESLAAADVYPAIWDEGAEAFDGYLAPYYTHLREFYRAAALNNEAVLLAIT